jgi:hypothetical protein
MGKGLSFFFICGRSSWGVYMGSLFISRTSLAITALDGFWGELSFDSLTLVFD